MMRYLAMIVSSVVLTAGVLMACGGGNNSSQQSAPPNTGGEAPYASPTTSPQPAGPQIVIANFGYTVPPSVKPGEQVTVVNKDDTAHTVTANNNAFDLRISGGGGFQTFTVPASPGTYPFYCKYHANMRGTLTVQ